MSILLLVGICAVSGFWLVYIQRVNILENSFCGYMFLYLLGEFTRGEAALMPGRDTSNYKKVKAVLSDGNSRHFTPLQRWVLSVILILPFR